MGPNVGLDAVVAQIEHILTLCFCKYVINNLRLEFDISFNKIKANKIKIT